MKKYLTNPVYWCVVYLPLIGVILVGGFWTVKIKAKISMCKIYYSEMTVWDCYWAPQFLPQRGNK